MTKIFNSDHSRRAMFCTLLSLLMWMVGIGGVSAGKVVVPRNPNVIMSVDPVYSDNGTEVTLKLWMYNYDGDNAHFIGDVYLTIDGSNVVKLNGMWSLFSNVYAKNEGKIKDYENRGNVGSQGTMMLDGVNIGTAQFCNVMKNQTAINTTEGIQKKWTTVDLKLSFNNSLSYRGHVISVNGMWRDWCDSKDVADKAWNISNKIKGFIYPDPRKFTVVNKGSLMRFTFRIPDDLVAVKPMYDGRWVLYKKMKGSSDFEVVSEIGVGVSFFDIYRQDFVCGATYYITFSPIKLSRTPIINGLTASLSKEHDVKDDVCRNCGHCIFRYTTSDGKPVTFANNLDFGSKILSNTDDGKGNFSIEFVSKISRIPDKAFYNSKINSNLVIPKTVISIGASAFANTACQDISLPLSLTEIGEGAFENCTNLQKLNLPSKLKKIGSRAFKGCNITGPLNIPNTVTEIGDGAFQNCSKLSGKLTLPANLNKIGSKAFENCNSFTGTLVIPNSVTEIGQDAFSDCSRFTGLSLPNNLRKIGYGAFARCINLSGPLSIPETVKEIGAYAFYNCTGFTGDFVLPSALESIGIDAFANTQDKNRLVFQSLPKGMANGYDGCKMRRYVNLSDASYVSDDANVYAYLDGASYVRTMTNTWGSLVLPYEMLLPSDAPYSVFTIEKMTNDEVVLKHCTFKLQPGVAYIVRRDGEEKTLTFSPDRSVEIRMKMQPADVGNLKFSGTYQAKEVTDGYILAQDRFWNVAKLKAAAPETQAVMVGPFRSWLEGTTANTSPSLSMRIGDSTTGIDNVAPLEMLNANDAEYYDLNGKRLDAPMKGVNIVKRGNKTMKVIIK